MKENIYLVSEPAERAEPAAMLEPEHLEGGGDDHLLLLVVRGRHTLEGLQALQRSLPTLRLVRGHAADSPIQIKILFTSAFLIITKYDIS